jgi:hypothetical protein
MDIFIENNNIKQYYISESLINFEAFNLYKKELKNYNCSKTSTIFIGVFTIYDILKIKQHKGIKFIYWTGDDANIANNNIINNIHEIKFLNINKHISANKLTQNNLQCCNIDSLIITLDSIKNFNKCFDFNKINQIYISPALIHLKDQVINKFNLKLYNNKTEDCVFFGLYHEDDIYILNKHLGKKYLMWGGNDALFESKSIYLNYIDKKNLFHIAISDDLLKRLNDYNLDPYIYKLNLVNTKIFKPIKMHGEKIFIYNGIKKGNEEIYGKHIYESIVKKLTKFNYIYSNELNISNYEMPNIYAQCFIGLRLTKNDGNANMVQEMEAMELPVVHNLSNYGLKWNSEDDIINHILKI